MTLYLSHFFYTVFGGEMTVYIDGLLFLNFYLDFLLLLTVVVVLKRNVKLFRIILGAFFGIKRQNSPIFLTKTGSNQEEDMISEIRQSR